MNKPSGTVWSLRRRVGALVAAASMLATIPAAAVAATATADDRVMPIAQTETQQYLELTIKRTDSNGSPVDVGDKLTYDITYKNIGSQNIVVYPKSTNLSGVLDKQADGKSPICRWSKLEPGKTGACANSNNTNLAYHVVTEDDVKNGFTPTAVIDATSDLDGKTVLQSVTITGDKVAVNEPAPPIDDPTITPPATIDAWNARNATLDDYKTLSSKLSKTDGINWLFIGDSITQGVVYTQGYRIYPELFANQVESEKVRGVSRANDMVMNTGISSADASWPLKNGAFDKWVTEKHPNVVFITFGMNDGREAKLFTVEQYLKNLSTIIDKVREQGAIPILQTQNYTTNATFNKNLDTYFDAERRLAIKKNVILIDFNKRWLEINNGVRESNTYMGYRNNIHPGENGHIEWAKFTLKSLNMLADGDPLAKWNSANVTLTGPSAGVDEAVKGLRGTAAATEAITVKPAAEKSVGKYLTGAQYVDLGADIAKAAKGGDAKQSNVTIRFRATATGKPQTLLTFGDPAASDTRSVIRLSETGAAQFVDSSAAGQYYTVGTKNLADGAWHTLSVNFQANGFTIYADGTAYRTIAGTSAKQLNVPSAIAVTAATAGATRDKTNPNGTQQLTGMIDYVVAYDSALSDADAKKLTTETADAADADAAAAAGTAATATKPVDVPVTTVTAAADALTPIISAVNDRKNIVFAGGETIEGSYSNHVIAKNVVQLLDERVRWEYVTGLTAKDTELARAKFFVGAAAGGRTVAQMDADFDMLIGRYKPDILFLMPDLYDAAGKLVEKNNAAGVTAFGEHVKSVAAKAKAAGSKVVLVTPVTVRGSEAEFAEAMRKVAAADGLPIIDAQAWMAKVVAAEPAVKTAWYNAAGQLNYAGHLGYARFLMKSLNLYPSNVSTSRVAMLPYDSIGGDLAGANEDGGTVPVARVEGADGTSGAAAKAHIDGTKIDPAKSVVIVDHYAVYEVGADGVRTPVEGLGDVAPETLLRDGVDVPLSAGDRGAHAYVVVGSAAAPDGVEPVTVTYTAQLAALEIDAADYTKVDEALKRVPADLSIYTDETADAVRRAVAAVKRGLSADEQKTVDAWAEAINTAVDGLEKKKTDGGDSGDPDNPVVPVKSVAVADANGKTDGLKVAVGRKLQLRAAVAPANASDKSVTWRSSAPGVATVNADGVVTGVSAGTVTISATSANGKVGSVSVTVVPGGTGDGNGGGAGANGADGADKPAKPGNPGKKPGLADTGASASALAGFAALLLAAGVAVAAASAASVTARRRG